MIDSFEGKYRFLSNFHNFWIVYEDIPYPSSEHAYQAAKSLDLTERNFISRLSTPGQSKRAGRELTLRADWHEVKEDVMYDILKIKFSNPILKEKLLETGDEVLIEGNRWHDNTWGVCTCPKCPGEGLNLLGKTLMRIRKEFQTL